MSERARSIAGVFVGLGALAVTYQHGCRRDETEERAVAPTSASQPPRRTHLLVFNESLHVEEASVNEFVRRAMTVCANGEYEEFRLLWSSRTDPLTRADFETGWQAVQKIRILALERVLLADDDAADTAAPPRPAYAIYAEVQLDPSQPAGRQEPRRQVVLAIIREHEAWRLTRAPESMRVWIKDVVARRSRPPDTGADNSDAAGSDQ